MNTRDIQFYIFFGLSAAILDFWKTLKYDKMSPGLYTIPKVFPTKYDQNCPYVPQCEVRPQSVNIPQDY